MVKLRCHLYVFSLALEASYAKNLALPEFSSMLLYEIKLVLSVFELVLIGFYFLL